MSDYTEIIDELRHHFDDVPLVLQAADAIEELALNLDKANNSEIKTSKWIPVTERLPEKDGKYLTAFKDGCVSDNFFMTPTGEKFKEVHPNGKWYWNETDRGGVTHWMPLPEPPKEE